jgi:flagellar protein FlaG
MEVLIMNVDAISNVNANYVSREATASQGKSEASQVQTEDRSVAVAEAGKPFAPIEGNVSKNDADAEQQGGSQQKQHEASEASIDDAVRNANRHMEHTRCEYSYHDKTKRVSIKVIDSDTDKVIREIPPEKSLDMLQKMWEMAGILVDEKR